MKEFGECICVVLFFAVAIYLVFCVIDAIVQNDKASSCRDNGYPDAVYIKNQGWYCVGISESNKPFLVEFEEATVRK